MLLIEFNFYKFLFMFGVVEIGLCRKDDLIYMSTPELIEHWGYKVENHTILTADDYVLTMHRIPNRNSKYYPLIFQHGILLASDSWVLRGPTEDLVLLLANRGFDIWLANTRGNCYSKKHKTLRSLQKRFWDFGIDNVGRFPSMHTWIVSSSKNKLHPCNSGYNFDGAFTPRNKTLFQKQIRVGDSVSQNHLHQGFGTLSPTMSATMFQFPMAAGKVGTLNGSIGKLVCAMCSRENYTQYSVNADIFSRNNIPVIKFLWNELGVHDIPAMIDHVRMATGREKVIHIGHSMGTTSFYAMLAKEPQYSKKVYAHLSLAPVAFTSRMRCLEVVRPITLIMRELMDLQDLLRLYDMFARDRRISLLISKICNVSKRNKHLCYKLMFYFVGPDFAQLKEEYFDRLMGHFPSGASSTMFMHFLQNSLSEDFREFDFGSAVLNKEKYGQPIPPRYNLTKVTTPVYLYYSTNDFLSHNLDVEKLATKLPNVKKKYLVPYKDFNHIDFIYAKDSKKLLYNDIIGTLKTFRIRF